MDFIHDDKSGENKICIVKCKPGTQYTIAHGAAEASKLIIGSYVGKRTDLGSMRVRNVIEVNLACGVPYVYTTTSDATYLVIQCLSTMGQLSKPKAVTTTLLLGDINFDGKIDILDKKLLADYLFYPEGHPNRPIFTNKQKVAADINNNGKIDQDDMSLLNAYLNRDIPPLEEIDYTYYVAPDMKEEDRIARLLIIEGDVTVAYTGETKVLETKDKQRGQVYGEINCSDISDWSKFSGFVELRSSKNNDLVKSYKLDGTKEYWIENIPNGTYNVIIDGDDFLKTVINNVVVKKGFKSIIQTVDLILGDVSKDNFNIIDSSDVNSVSSNGIDLNKDGVFDSIDENIVTKNLNKSTESDCTFEWAGETVELPIQESSVEYPITKSKLGINFGSFKDDPWIVHDKFIPYLLGMSIHKYSRSEEITMVQDMLRELYPERFDDYVAGHYSDEMRNLVLQYQMSKYNVKAGDLHADGLITETDEQMLLEYLDGDRELTLNQQLLADTNGDTNVDESDYNLLRKYRQGIVDTLNVYEIPFYLGWVDVQTEAYMMKEINNNNKLIKEVGWR